MVNYLLTNLKVPYLKVVPIFIIMSQVPAGRFNTYCITLKFEKMSSKCLFNLSDAFLAELITKWIKYLISYHLGQLRMYSWIRISPKLNKTCAKQRHIFLFQVQNNIIMWSALQWLVALLIAPFKLFFSILLYPTKSQFRLKTYFF